MVLLDGLLTMAKWLVLDRVWRMGWSDELFADGERGVDCPSFEVDWR